MSEREEELKQAILHFVEETQEDINIVLTQTMAMNAVMKDIGGSTNTYKKIFDELFDAEKDGRLVKTNVRKQIWTLTLSEKQEQLIDFENKMKVAEDLIDLLERTPEVGDCVYMEQGNAIKFHNTPGEMSHSIPCQSDEIFTCKHGSNPCKHVKLADQIKNPRRSYAFPAIKFRIDRDYPPMSKMRRSIQGRYDILKNLAVFLVGYINSPDLNYTKTMKKRARSMITPIVTKCVDMLQLEYGLSQYYTDTYREKHTGFFHEMKITALISEGILIAKGLPMDDMEAEFLKILGRYYFAVSVEFGDYNKIDSTDEQKTITAFAKSFFSKSDYGPEGLWEKINDRDKVYDYITQTLTKENKSDVDMFYKLQNGTFGGRFSKRYNDLEHNDPPTISDYYMYWIFNLGLFSRVEKKLIQITYDYSQKHDELMLKYKIEKKDKPKGHVHSPDCKQGKNKPPKLIL